MAEREVSNPLLTILIPSRNRAGHVLDVLESLETFLTEDQKSKLEVLISDNSDLDTRLPKDFSKFSTSLCIRIVYPPHLLLTAEDNLFFSWQFTVGKYVWILGDDDPINFLQMTNLFNLLSEAEFLAYFWNSNLISMDGEVLKMKRIPVANGSFSTTLGNLVMRAGAWYATSGFSTWVISREILNSSQSKEWMDSSKGIIYSHVTLLLRILSNEKIKFVDESLVYYRINDYDVTGNRTNWQNYAKASARYYRQPWIYDFPKQIDSLVMNGFLPEGYLGSIIEQNHLGERIPLILIMADLLLEQIEISLGEQSEIVPEEHLNYILNQIKHFAPSIPIDANKLIEINQKMIAMRSINKRWYIFAFKKYGADIHLMRHNLNLFRIRHPFQDFLILNKAIDLSVNRSLEACELQFVDYGLNGTFFYKADKETMRAQYLQTNIFILRFAQYLPKIFRMILKRLMRFVSCAPKKREK